jgi:S-sulfo-L-cysteine synthase (O-acetyl-L-serine-dependent)
MSIRTPSPAAELVTHSIVDMVGHTPLIRLSRFESEVPAGVELWAKAEWLNPGGSVKDRPAVRMVLEGERSGLLGPGRTILDATSGNTGIAYAMIGAARGYPVTLCIPSNVTPERKRILRAYGAELVFTDPLEGSDGAIRRVRAMYEADPAKYFYPDQYNNPANWQAHYDTTGPEILAQTDGRITHFVAGLGTSGTFVGTGRFLQEQLESVQLVSVQPDTALHGLEGLKHMESAIVPGIYDDSLAHIDMRIGTEESYDATRRLAVEQGLLVGISSGAALAAGMRVGRTLDRGGVIVMLFADGGEKYLSERFWEEPAEGSIIGGVN